MSRFALIRAAAPLLRRRLFLLGRPAIGDAADHRGAAELLAQIIHRALGVGVAAIDHVGVVARHRSRLQRADAGADQAKRRAVDFLRQQVARGGENPPRQLGRRADRLRAGALAEIGGFQLQRDS